MADGKRVFEHEPGEVLRYEFRLSNTGSATVTGLGVVKVEGSPALQLERLASQPLEEDDYDDTVMLELRQGRSCSTGVATLDALWIRYTVLGMDHEQRVPLVRGPVVRCR
jgi:hypothetical protein